MAYANGRIPDAQLVTIPGGARLLAPVAAIWLAVRAEVTQKHGWTPAPTGPLDGYRPLDGNYYAQHETFMRRYQPSYTQYATGKVDARKYNGITFYRKRGEDAAAVPGTSNHGWACAIDVAHLGSNPTWYAQFAAVAVRHGLSNTEGLSVGEKWHWTHPGTVTQVKNGVTFAGAVPHIPNIAPPAPLAPEDNMTPDQAKLLEDTAQGVAELRRILAMMIGVTAPGTEAEGNYITRETLHRQDSAEARRMLGVILAWQNPQGPERDALHRLQSTPTSPGA